MLFYCVAYSLDTHHFSYITQSVPQDLKFIYGRYIDISSEEQRNM